jgi:hypothetical protein
MYVPSARERVEVVGRPEMFFVLTVNREAQYAEVVSLSKDPRLLVVSFKDVRPYLQDSPLEAA